MILLSTILWLLPSFAVGYLLSRRLLGRGGSRALAAALAPIVGMGTSSLLSYLLLSLGSEFLVPWVELLALIALAVLPRSAQSEPLSPEPAPLESGPPWLFVAMLLVIGLAAFSFLSHALDLPHGGTDATAIWNLRARFLFRAPEHWQDAFTPILGSSHPNYPPLLPLTVARVWGRIGVESCVAPALIAACFLVSACAVLFVGLKRQGSRILAACGVMLVLGNTVYLRTASSQLADVPLSCYILAALVLANDKRLRQDSRHLVLVGLLAGFAAWTKNEGTLFLLTFLCASLLSLLPLRRSELRRVGVPWLLGAAAPLLALAHFKIAVAPPGVMLSPLRSGLAFELIADPARWLLVWKTVLSQFLLMGTGLLLLLFVVCVVDRSRPGRSSLRTRAFPILTILLLLSGYALVYIALSPKAESHMDTSLERLLLHLWPGVIFGLLTLLRVAPAPESSLGENDDTHP